ncbi:MAG TPA: type 4a pilus biogenesis protein PilO [bacterium]|nr:type 4a pilus biogenesis protein PilO [bacterium]
MRQLTARETVLVAAAAALAVIVPLYSFVFAPETAAMSALNRRVEAQNKQLTAIAASAGRLPTLERDHAGVAARLQQEEQQMPSTINVSGLMGRLSAAIAASGTQLVEVTFPAGTQPTASATDPVQELALTVRLRGTFGHIVTFLQFVEAAPAVVSEQSLAIAGGAPPVPGDGALEATVGLKAIALK